MKHQELHYKEGSRYDWIFIYIGEKCLIKYIPLLHAASVIFLKQQLQHFIHLMSNDSCKITWDWCTISKLQKLASYLRSFLEDTCIYFG